MYNSKNAGLEVAVRQRFFRSIANAFRDLAPPPSTSKPLNFNRHCIPRRLAIRISENVYILFYSDERKGKRVVVLYETKTPARKINLKL